MKKILLLSCVLLLTSCRTQMAYPIMAKAGASEQQRKTDVLQCKMMAVDFRSKMAMGGGGPAGVMVNGNGVMGPGPSIRNQNLATEAANEIYIECMEERGYDLVKEKESIEIK